ncbi:MAG: NAD(P)H-hydrate dehydratase [Polyangiaceae bacterium]|nr:NAD(P)H-hydrate dehydratase [Polyangiaceae bacterium]
MIPVLSKDQMRAFDADASARCHVSGLVLMENAGRGAAELVEKLARAGAAPGGGLAPLIVCGTGNNGGDGLVLARQLLVRGLTPKVLVVGAASKFSAETRAEFEALVAIGGDVALVTPEAAEGALLGQLSSAGVIVDALFGIGLDRELLPPWPQLLGLLNAANAVRVALDIPSGIHADSGQPLGAALVAHHTVTFAAPKLGMLTTVGADHTGQIHIVPIGVPGPSLGSGISGRILETADVSKLLVARAVSAHKGSVGRVAVVAGSPGKVGAAFLCARGALRAGAALVTLVGFADTTSVFAERVTEEMTATLEGADIEGSVREALRGMDVVVVGPGFGLGERERRVVAAILAEFSGKVVVDADALTHFAGRAADLAASKARLVLTPHPGEMGRLLGISAQDVEANRFSVLERAVRLTGQAVLLKGPRTLIGAPGEVPFVNRVGSPALATGGSGDVLSGIVGALCLRLSPFEAAACAAFLHGQSGQNFSDITGADRGLLAREIADGVPEVLAALAGPSLSLPL